MFVSTPSVTFSDNGNVAINRPCASYKGSCAYGVDGNRYQIGERGGCFDSGIVPNPWWRVDLAETHLVREVRVTARLDLFQYQLTGLEVRVGRFFSAMVWILFKYEAKFAN